MSKIEEPTTMADAPEWLRELLTGQRGMAKVLYLFAEWLEARINGAHKTVPSTPDIVGPDTVVEDLSRLVDHVKDVANWGPAPMFDEPGYDHFARLIGKLGFILNMQDAKPWTSEHVVAATLQKVNEVTEVQKGYHALDRNWSTLHNKSMDAIRDVVGNKEATVPEIVDFIMATRKRLEDVTDIHGKNISGAYEALDAAFPEFKFAGIDNGIKKLAEQRQEARDKVVKVRTALAQMTYLYEREHEPWHRPVWLQVALGDVHEESAPPSTPSPEKPKGPHPLTSLPEYVQRVSDHVHAALMAAHDIDGPERDGITRDTSRKAFAKALDHLVSAGNIIQREWQLTQPRSTGKPKLTTFSCSAPGCEAKTETPYSNGWTRDGDHWACKDHSTAVTRAGIPRDGSGSLLLVHQVNDLMKPGAKCGIVLRPGDWRTTNTVHVTCRNCAGA